MIVNREHINKIRDDFQASQRVKDSLNNSIQTLARDLYSKDTHFIFELIQNAEDNTYQAVEPSLSFRLIKTDPTGTNGSDGVLIVQNNEIGFSPENVDAICAVGKTTKSKIQGYIGEKGIGFKSVFRVTTIPHIFSNGYSFCLPEYDEETGLGYIVPRWIEKPLDGIKPCQTTIILPLDKADFGYDAIEEMLQDIEPETILFLSKLKEIKIETDSEDSLTILKDDSKMPFVNVLVKGKIKGEPFSKEDKFLLYSQTYNKPDDINHEKRMNINERNISIAFPLNEGKESTGKIFAYLPVRSDIGLPFSINADFILTSSREDVQKNVPWNLWLMNCTANLVGNALPLLKEQGLLTITLLEIFASRMYELAKDSLFCLIPQTVRDAFLNKELLPTDDGSFISARNAKLASAEWLRKLLNKNELGELFNAEKPLKWISGDITERTKPNLWKYIREKLEVEEVTPDSFARKIDENFLINRSDEWMISFYKYIAALKALWKQSCGWWDQAGPLRTREFIRLQDGSHVKPFQNDNSPNAYLTVGTDTETTLPIVKTKISQHKEVYQFLKELGIPELDIVAEVIEEIIPKYTRSGPFPIDEHKRDIEKIILAYATDSQEKKHRLKKQLQATSFVISENPAKEKLILRRPTELYFSENELLTYFSGNKDVGFVWRLYTKEAAKMLEDIGVSKSVKVKRRESDHRGYLIIRDYRGRHERGLNGFDPDIEIDGLENALSNPTIEKSLFIWTKIAKSYSSYIRGIVEKSDRHDYNGSSKEERVSKFGNLLINSAWLPDHDDNFHKPSELHLDELPESFVRDKMLSEQLGMKRDVLAELAEKSGIPEEIIGYLRQNPIAIQKLTREIEESKKEVESVPEAEDDGWNPEYPPDEVPIVTESFEPDQIESPDLTGQQTQTNNGSKIKTTTATDTPESKLPRNQKEIGEWGEKYVFRLLKREYEKNGNGSTEVIWLNKDGNIGKGYDFVIKDNTEEVKYIEVKTKTAEEPELIETSGTQWEFARTLYDKNEGDKYWYYVVSNAGSANPKCQLIQNPIKLWKEGKLYAHPIHFKI